MTDDKANAFTVRNSYLVAFKINISYQIFLVIFAVNILEINNTMKSHNQPVTLETSRNSGQKDGSVAKGACCQVSGLESHAYFSICIHLCKHTQIRKI